MHHRKQYTLISILIGYTWFEFHQPTIGITVYVHAKCRWCEIYYGLKHQREDVCDRVWAIVKE
jgi:hypothetical protein